jgi:gamma-glutamylcyclotransferase (GGCT)/AIG2-like uncharacterized protein YtfP
MIYKNLGANDMSGNNLVFIYGSLKQGYHNDFWMEGTAFLQEAVTSDAAYCMHPTAGMFPLVVPGKYKIAGELYAVDDEALAELDRLEGNGDVYTRKQIKLSGVDAYAWMYTYNHTDNIPPTEGLGFLVSETDSVQTWLRPEDHFEFEVQR